MIWRRYLWILGAFPGRLELKDIYRGSWRHKEYKGFSYFHAKNYRKIDPHSESESGLSLRFAKWLLRFGMGYWDPLQLLCFALSQQRACHCTIAGSAKDAVIPHYQMLAAEVASDKLQSPHE